MYYAAELARKLQELQQSYDNLHKAATEAASLLHEDCTKQEFREALVRLKQAL